MGPNGLCKIIVNNDQREKINQELTSVEITRENYGARRIISHVVGDEIIGNSFENKFEANSKSKPGPEPNGFNCELASNIKYSKLREKNDLFLSLRSLLIFGRFIGLISWRGLFQKDVRQLEFKKFGLMTLISMFIRLLLIPNLTMSLIDLYNSKPKNAVDYAWIPTNLVYSILGLFLYNFFYKHSGTFISLLQQWNRMELNFPKEDKNLKLHVNLIAGLILTSAILENLTGEIRIILPFILPVKYGGRSDAHEINALRVFYKESRRIWADVVPYNPVLTVLLFVWDKCVLYTWNFMDVTLIVFARAIYFKFKMLVEQAETDLIGGSRFLENIKRNFLIAPTICLLYNMDLKTDPEKWRQFTKDHGLISAFLDDIVKLFSPVVFASYAVNIYFIVLHVHLGLTPKKNETIVDVIYFKWSFLHLLARLILVTLFGAKIHEWAHKSIELFRKCPERAYMKEVERTERYLRMSTMGYTGLGCFRVTKPLILEIVGVVFTFEIVLLQANNFSQALII